MNKEILKNINVLYVEDEKDVREFTSKTLGSIVNTIIVAQDGEEGLIKFKENSDINIILADINMPKMDGIKMCSEIRKINNKIPIIITSAHSDPHFLNCAINVKVSSFALKPINLYNLIENMIKSIEPIFLKLELENINNKLDKEESTKKIQQVLDSQYNIVLITSILNITNVNNKFLEFFGVNSIEEFLNKNTSLLSIFKEEKGFFSLKSLNNKDNWLNELLELKDLNRIIKIKNNLGKEKVFIINIDKYDQQNSNYILSFTDITEREDKLNILRYQNNYDQLTGLFNKEKFNKILIKEIKRNNRYKSPLSIIIFNIDDFNSFNKNFGHSLGDQVLKLISEIVINSVREHDSIVRWESKDFLVLLPQTNLDGARIVAEKIRNSIKNLQIDQVSKKITASFGVTKLKEIDNEESIISRAREALYQAKNEGKDLVSQI